MASLDILTRTRQPPLPNLAPAKGRSRGEDLLSPSRGGAVVGALDDFGRHDMAARIQQIASEVCIMASVPPFWGSVRGRVLRQRQRWRLGEARQRGPMGCDNISPRLCDAGDT